MAFADDEISPHDGDTVELYEFIGPQIAYRYTSCERQIVLNGNVYTPVAGLVRTAIGANSTGDTAALAVSLPVTTQVIRDYGLDDVPPRSLLLRVYRRQERSAEYVEIWIGSVNSIQPMGRMAEVRSISQLGERLDMVLPSVSVQRLCNHFLFDRRCRVDRLTYDFETVVTNVSGATVTLASIGIAPDQWFRAGEIVRNVDGERRAIVDQAGAVLTLAHPFRTLLNGNGVTLYAGCDHTLATCSDKFNNAVNFGGHPTVPSSNPFLTPIRLTRGS